MNQYHLLFPFELVPRGANVLLYGAGRTGQHYLKQLLMTGYCNVVGMIDKKFTAYSSMVVPVYSLEKVIDIEYDYIVICMLNQTYNHEIISDLHELGVQDEKIVYIGQREDVACKKEINESDKNFERDFSLNSGERSTAKTIEEIRKDHVNRYEMVGEYLKNIYAPPQRTIGLDCFCGTGYGSAIIADTISHAHILAIDGSEEATAFGNQYYSRKYVWRCSKVWPFILPKDFFDFVVSFESVEHVPDGEQFIEELISSLKPGGYFFCSVPNAKINSLELNKDVFHYRHWSDNELEPILEKNTEIVKKYGQDMFYFENGVKCGVVPAEDMVLKENSQGAVLVYICRKK